MYRIKKNLIYALVPIKEKSERIQGKNFVKIKNIHLFEYTLKTLKKCKFIKKIYISSDSRKAALVAQKKYKIDIPFMRPKGISKSKSNDKSYVDHFISYIIKDKFLPEFILQMRVTTPFRDVKIIKQAISKIKKHPECTSLRSVETFSHPIEKVFTSKNKFYQDYKGDKINSEKFNKPSQYFKEILKPNGYIDILKTNHLLKSKNIYGEKILKFISPKTLEIDDMEDLNFLKKYFKL